jgi:predicted nuclease of predicted toxin-antitoxin system
MKLLFDQNLSFRIIKKINHCFPESRHVAALKLDRASDIEIWEYAKDYNFTIVTKDSDFNDLSTLKGFPPHIIWLRLGNSRSDTAANALLQHADTIEKIISNAKEGIIEIHT